MTKASTTYMMPIFLWSVLVSQSDHNTPHLRYLGDECHGDDAADHQNAGRCAGNDAVDHVLFGWMLQQGMQAQPPQRMRWQDSR
ncbi:MAG TPA: hypothetical protein VFW10_12145 [Steroidobacteraceae bacterium]|nr:hypothetical protein [Steroidobacteraceae bacterium]